VFSNETGKIADSEHRILVHGQGELVEAVAGEFLARGALVAVTGTVDGCVSVAASSDEGQVIADAADALGGLTVLANVCFPVPAYGVEFVTQYPERLRARCAAAADVLIRSNCSTAIINHCALPAMYVGTELEDYMSSLRGGVTGVTRTFARKYGKQGLRATAVQSGLVELSDTSWVSSLVQEVQVPIGKWASLEEIAKFMVFLALDSTYTTGQTMIMDGGLTAGISGT
jgi:NAD(P)-dependent dehydrogenase (short-subunit alcohol dehydrogenase family)